MINACVQTWSRRGERRRFLLKRETARRDKQASSLLFFSVQRRRFSRPVLSFHNGASTQLDWNSIRTSSANITGRKTGASRDARQQVGNWYRRQSVSQPASQVADRLLSYGTRNGFTGVLSRVVVVGGTRLILGHGECHFSLHFLRIYK